MGEDGEPGRTGKQAKIQVGSDNLSSAANTSPWGSSSVLFLFLVTGAWCSPGRGPADVSGALILAAVPALVCSLWHSLLHPPSSPRLGPSELLASPWLLQGGCCVFVVLTACL